MSRPRPSPLVPRRVPLASAAVAVTGLALLLAGVAVAEPSKTPPRDAVASLTNPSATLPAPAPLLLLPLGTSGMMVAIEPETGALVMPTREQMLRLTAAEATGLLRTSADLAQTRLADGTVMMDLQGRFMEFEVARIDARGRPHVISVNDLGALLRLFDPATPLPAPCVEEE